MADDFQAPDENPFDQLMKSGGPAEPPSSPSGGAPQPAPAAIQADQQRPQQQQENPFGAPVPAIEGDSSAGGAFIREAAGAIGPTAGAIAGGAAGAKIGGGIGALFGPADEATVPIGAAVGGFLGGIGGGFAGAYGGGKLQDFAVSKLPDDWQESINSQKQVDEQQHPTASFIGGLAPYLVTMSPMGAAKTVLPATATTFQRLMANPITQRVFGGGLMGGMELGQEAEQGQVDWGHVAIATGFGMIFSRPNPLGAKIHAAGEAPITAFGDLFRRSVPETVANLQGVPSPTLAQGADTKTIGAGITEAVHQGQEVQNPVAEMVAQQNMRDEMAVTGTTPQQENDLHDLARRVDPETFEQYDNLSAQRDTFRGWLNDFANPPDEHLAEAKATVDGLQAQLDQHVADANGYTGGAEARRLRAQVRDAQTQFDALNTRRAAYGAGEVEDTPEAAAVRQRLQQVDYAMRDLAPQVSAAYRRAAEFTGSDLVPPPPPDTLPEAAPPPAETQGAPLAEGEAKPPAQGAPAPLAQRTLEEQLGFIANDVAQKLVRAGRPVDEALAAGQVEAHHYVSRALRFKGALGTPEELYNREGSEIRGGPGVQPSTAVSSPKFTAPAPPRTPPLMPTLEKPTIAPEPVLAQAAETPPPTPAEQPAAGAAPEPNGNGIEALDPTTIGVDANRFQFKAGGDASGVTDRLQDVKTWDPRLGGTVMVFRDADGKDWIADGHQRLGLAKRLSATQPGIKVNAFVLDAADGVTDSDARQIAAAANIAQGTGTSIDAAKIMREAKDQGKELPPLPPRSALVREGTALANLSPDAFGMAVNEVVPTNQAAIVGKLVSDPLVQSEAMRVLAEAKPDNLRQAEMIVREIMNTGTEEMTRQGGLFGEEHFASSIVLERAKIADQALQQVKRDKAVFGTLVREAERIEGLGQNALDAETNKGRLTDDEQATQYLTKLAFQTGPVSDALSGIARRLKAGDISVAAAAREFGDHVRAALKGQLDEGANTGRIEPGAAGEREGVEGAPERDPDTLEMFQNTQDREFDQVINGKIRFGPSNKPIVTLMATADASTFMHETGHKYLEELFRDDQHEQAPEDLKADAQTTRDWLSMKDGQTLPTRAQHEKFARGFEQYLREGVAPSPQLATVFGKFRNWLVSIYKTLTGLGKPINDDIRGVFDRLLANEPEHTVIVPEQEPVQTIAHLHALDAEHTEPRDADATAERINVEKNRFIEGLPPHIAAELNARLADYAARTAAAGETGEGAGGSSEVVPGGGGSEPIAGGGARGEDSGPVVSSGDEGGAKGGGLPAGSDSGSVGPGNAGTGYGAERSIPAKDAGSGLAPAAPTLFGPAESPLVDKAGNIRLDNLTNSEEVRQVIRDAAAANNDFIGDRRGVVTDGQIRDLADDLGMTYSSLLARRVGQAFNAEEIYAARRLLNQSAFATKELMDRVSLPGSTDEDVLAYAKARDRHQMIQGQIAGITAEWGRAGRAFRDISGENAQAASINQFLKGATGKDLYQLRMEAKMGAGLDTPQKISKFMQDAQKNSFGRMILEYWINGLISGPATHTTYAIGNTILALEKAGPETAAASAIGALRSAFGRSGETVRLGEVGAQLASLRNLGPAIKAGIDAFRTGGTTLLPGEDLRKLSPEQRAALDAYAQGAKPISMPFQPGGELLQPEHLDEAAGYSDAVGSAFGLVRGVRDGFQAIGTLLSGGVQGSPAVGLQRSPGGFIPDIMLRGVNVLPVGSAARLPGRFIAAIHSFFRAVNYSMEKNALSYRHAANQGLVGPALDAEVARLRQSPPPEMMEASRNEATNLTLMGPGGEFVRKLGQLTNASFNLPILGETQLLKFIDPFVHIAANVLDQSLVQRTPIGVLSPEIRADLMGKNGNVAADKAAARMLVGTAVAIGFGSLAAEGYISGSGPSDPKDAAVWRQAGNQAHSVRIGDTWYDIHRLGPMGMIMGMAADLYDVAHTADQGEYLNAASMLQHAITQNVLDESFMRGPAELMQAVEDPGRYGQAYIRNFASSFVPYSVGMSQMARATDPYSRQARSVLDAMRNKIPGLSETLLPRRDIWGMPMPNKGALLAPGVTAIYEQQISSDPVNQAMVNLGMGVSQPERRIRNVPLNDQQYDDYSRIAGITAKQRLDAIVNSPQWKTWAPESQRDVINETIKQSREMGRNMVMMKYPEIPAQAAQVKLQRK